MSNTAIPRRREQGHPPSTSLRPFKVDLLSTRQPVSRLRIEIRARFEDGRAFMLSADSPDMLPPSRHIQAAPHLDIAMVQRTSGTTGRPREFVFSRDAVLTHAKATAQVMGISKHAPVALAITPGTAYYASVLMMANMTESPLTLIDPLSIREAAEQIKYEPLVSLDAGVRFWQTIEHFARRDLKFLHAVREIRTRGVGGDPLPASTEACYRAHGAPLTNGYGLTQAGPNVAIGMKASPRVPGSCGFPLPEVELKIVGEELHVRTPYVASAEVRENATCAIPEMTGNGWLRTGDRAEIVDGQLIPLGRLSQRDGGEQ